MKGFFVIFLAIYLFTVEAATHRKNHKGIKNVKDDVAVTTAGDAWPTPSSIGDFGVPDKFQEDPGSGDTEEKSVKHQRRTPHKSRPN